MNAEKNAIGVLSITAVLLLAALIFLPRAATGQAAIKDNDFLICTLPAAGGSDALYIAETRNMGVVAAFVWDANNRQLAPRAMSRIGEFFRMP